VFLNKAKTRLSVCAALLAVGGCAVCEMGGEAEEVRRVESFDLSGATCGLGKRVQKGMSVDGNPLTVGGRVYAHGFGTRPESAVLFRATPSPTSLKRCHEWCSFVRIQV